MRAQNLYHCAIYAPDGTYGQSDQIARGRILYEPLSHPFWGVVRRLRSALHTDPSGRRPYGQTPSLSDQTPPPGFEPACGCHVISHQWLRITHPGARPPRAREEVKRSLHKDLNME